MLFRSDWVHLSTRTGTARATLELSDDMQAGHVSLPNGQGLDYADEPHRRGVSLNELTSSLDCDPIAGTPWHKYVPVRLERVVA